jgi:hypothetical protein
MGEVEDLAAIQNIYWIDDRPESVAGLTRALGVQGNPPHFVAFFPISLEEKLAQLERDYHGIMEAEVWAKIHSTRFEILNNGPVVTAQQLR